MAAVTTLMASTAMAAMSQPEIEAGVRAANSELSACYDDAVERNENLKTGRMVIRYVVTTEGKVAEARVTRNDLHGNRFFGQSFVLHKKARSRIGSAVGVTTWSRAAVGPKAVRRGRSGPVYPFAR